jgi:hypothetical protein
LFFEPMPICGKDLFFLHATKTTVKNVRLPHIIQELIRKSIKSIGLDSLFRVSCHRGSGTVDYCFSCNFRLHFKQFCFGDYLIACVSFLSKTQGYYVQK